MTQDPKAFCRRFGLIYIETSALQVRRQRCGKGFTYRDGTGKTIRDKAVKARIKQLAIPPAWSEVLIAADERAHIQAVGRDAEGRLQYRYHADWDKARATANESTETVRLLASAGAGCCQKGACRSGSESDQSRCRCRPIDRPRAAARWQ
jgi:DNA topoisomerase IB